MLAPGRAAIVTGGAGGLGAATARRLSAAGMKVAIFDRHAERAEAVARDLGNGALAVVGDTTADDDVARAIDGASELGRLSVLVNVAGGGGIGGGRTVNRDGTPHDKQAFLSTMDLNVVGTFNVTRLVCAAMATNPPDDDGLRGAVINTASIAGFEGQAGMLAYASAKAAILGMTLPLARDLAPVGIRVCAIAPGTMGTPAMLRAPAALKEELVDTTVFPKRMGQPEEFARLVEFIVSNDYINGENIRLDGGSRLPGSD